VSSPTDLRSCDRCGRRRYVKNSRPGVALCGDCRAVEPSFPAVTFPQCLGHEPGAFAGACPTCEPVRVRVVGRRAS
jgi:hypothetical protein